MGEGIVQTANQMCKSNESCSGKHNLQTSVRFRPPQQGSAACNQTVQHRKCRNSVQDRHGHSAHFRVAITAKSIRFRAGALESNWRNSLFISVLGSRQGLGAEIEPLNLISRGYGPVVRCDVGTSIFSQ